MRKKTSQWSKDVRKAVIDKDITLKELAENIGYSFPVVSSVINGRYSNTSYRKIAAKINNFLGTEGLPERVAMPSPEWCKAVKIELLGDEKKQKPPTTVSQLAKDLGISRDRLSLVINGKMMDEKIIADVNNLLNITIPSIPSDDD